MVTLELDLGKLRQDIATLRKNRENVPLELLKTKYKKPYAKLKEEIRAQLQIYLKELVLLGISRTTADFTPEKQKVMANQIQKIIDEGQAAGYTKLISHAVFEEFDLNKAENIACGYYTSRVEHEAYAPYWLEHIHQDQNGKYTSDLLPEMEWCPDTNVWVNTKELSFTCMLPPTQEEIDKKYEADQESFRKYMKEVKRG